MGANALASCRYWPPRGLRERVSAPLLICASFQEDGCTARPNMDAVIYCDQRFKAACCER